jgi:hypothetical protein
LGAAAQHSTRDTNVFETGNNIVIEVLVHDNGSPASAGIVVNLEVNTGATNVLNQVDNQVTLTNPSPANTNASGIATFTFTPASIGVASGSAGYIVFTAKASTATKDSDPIIVGFDDFRVGPDNWETTIGGQDGAVAACSGSSAYDYNAIYALLPGYDTETYIPALMLPTTAQLVNITNMTSHKPSSFPYILYYWSGYVWIDSGFTGYTAPLVVRTTDGAILNTEPYNSSTYDTNGDNTTGPSYVCLK